MAYTETINYISSVTLYAKKKPFSATWGDEIVHFTANANYGAQYTCSTFVDGEEYTVFVNLGGVVDSTEASTDTRTSHEIYDSNLDAANIVAIKAVSDSIGTASATQLGRSAGNIISFTVDTVTNGHSPTTTVFQCDDITEATENHFKDRTVIFRTGALTGQAKTITAYELVGGIGQFTVGELTEAPANNDEGDIV